MRVPRVSTTLTAGALIASLLIVCPAPLSAIERRPLPDFTVAALDGSSVTSADIVLPGRWLLVYVQSSCAACDALFRIIDPGATTDPPPSPSHMVIVVGGVDGPTAAKLASNFSDLAGATWYADPSMALRQALDMSLAPVVFGLRDNQLDWSILGVQPDAPSVKSALTSWVGTIQ
jgi:hypothetical protein